MNPSAPPVTAAAVEPYAPQASAYGTLMQAMGKYTGYRDRADTAVSACIQMGATVPQAVRYAALALIPLIEASANHIRKMSCYNETASALDEDRQHEAELREIVTRLRAITESVA